MTDDTSSSISNTSISSGVNLDAQHDVIDRDKIISITTNSTDSGF